LHSGRCDISGEADVIIVTCYAKGTMMVARYANSGPPLCEEGENAFEPIGNFGGFEAMG
jgi:hypothetical protein